MKIKPYEETHMEGTILLDNNPFFQSHIEGNLGILITEDGRMWICIDGLSFIRFTPKRKHHEGGNE